MGATSCGLLCCCRELEQLVPSPLLTPAEPAARKQMEALLQQAAGIVTAGVRTHPAWMQNSTPLSSAKVVHLPVTGSATGTACPVWHTQAACTRRSETLQLSAHHRPASVLWGVKVAKKRHSHRHSEPLWVMQVWMLSRAAPLGTGA
jgi:hypothetical protein